MQDQVAVYNQQPPRQRDFYDFVDWAFKAVLTGLAIMGYNTMQEMTASIDRLNTVVAVAIEKSASQDKKIEENTARIRRLEELQMKQSRGQ